MRRLVIDLNVGDVGQVEEKDIHKVGTACAVDFYFKQSTGGQGAAFFEAEKVEVCERRNGLDLSIQ